jgi:hypothetical protein
MQQWRNCWRRHFLYGPCHIKGESVGLCIPLSLLGNGLVNTFPRQRRIVGGIVFYAVRVVSKEIRQSVLPRTSVIIILHTCCIWGSHGGGYKSMVFWVVILCILERAGYFRGMYHLHLQGQTVRQSKKPARWALPSASASFLLGLLFNPEDGGNIYLLNVRLSLKYIVLQQKRLHFSSYVEFKTM